jgi:hypothetical protein
VKGDFRFSNLGPGDWRLQTDDYGRISDSRQREVNVSDQNDPVDLIVKLRDAK